MSFEKDNFEKTLGEEFSEMCAMRLFAHELATDVFLACGNDKSNFRHLHFQTTKEFPKMLESIASGTRFNRPQTFELLCDFIRAYDVELLAVCIHDFVKKTYIAQICFVKAGAKGGKPRVVCLDARPSDAILLATSFRVKILVKKTLFEKVGDATDLLKQLEFLQKNKADRAGTSDKKE